MNIPILRPLLPSSEKLLPYLKRIDEARFYSNFGPLSLELQQRLAQHLNFPNAQVISAANATIALTAALMAQNPPKGSLCVMPAWTFIASPLAAMAAGLTPHFVDVSYNDWLLHPANLLDRLGDLARKVGAVMPVAAFGQPVRVSSWDQFRQKTGLAVVIDSAAGFDQLDVGDTPNIVSLHATKALGAGEGGFITSTDTDLLQRIQTYLAFGFYGTREAQVSGFNGKMSEYNAAVALASLDEWPQTRERLMQRAQAYRRGIGQMQDVRFQAGFGEDWVANTCNIELPSKSGPYFAEQLALKGIETRLWWGQGAHEHPATRHLSRSELKTTQDLANTTLGLPFYVDLSFDDIEKIATEIQALHKNMHASPVNL